MQEVADLIADLPRDEKLITVMLRGLIIEAGPRLQEKISYGVPYFYHHRRVCFLWPASRIPCGWTRPDDPRVTLGLCYGNLLSNDQGLLIAGKRKQVFVIPFRSLDDIDERAVTEIIHEAVLVDDQFFQRRKK